MKQKRRMKYITSNVPTSTEWRINNAQRDEYIECSKTSFTSYIHLVYFMFTNNKFMLGIQAKPGMKTLYTN